MAIANLTQEVSLGDSDFLGLPVMHHISDAGYWYTYHPSDFDSNNVLAGNSIIGYEWDSVLTIGSSSQLAGSPSKMELDGTLVFIDESHGSSTLRYHGGCIQDIGSGVNDITNLSENDAFFFAHIGTFGDDGTTAAGTLEDDAFYWDRAYQQNAGGEWNFYQYHKHLPSNYSKYDDGRIVFASDGFIRPADKQFGYLINILAKNAGKSYSVPLARIHTPSVGGAHNSHNDVTLPNTAGINYLPGGILKGGSNRFHAFYMDDAGASGWNIYSRTYTSSSGSFTPEVSYGAYTLADPLFTPYAGGSENAEGSQSEYSLRASAGHTFGSKVYIPVVMEAEERNYDFEVSDVVGGGIIYEMTGNDRGGSYGPRQQPTIYLKVGDTITIENAQYAAHPMYIRDTTSIAPTPTSHNVAGASGGGTGSSTLTFTPQSTGTVYYICSLHSGMYGQIVITPLAGTFDQQIWSFTDANTISPGTLNRIDLPYDYHGLSNKPDCYITSVGSNIYIAGSSGLLGGVQLFSVPNQLDSAGQLTREGNIVTNDSDDLLRIHGFKYNSSTTKFFTLISGPSQAPGNYVGKGLYSFDLAGGAFDGYEHLSYDISSGTYLTKDALQSGHLRYDHPTATIKYDTGTEPEGIPSGTSILQYDVASPNFFGRKEVNTGNEEYFFQGIYLQDGRKALVGRVEGHEGNLGIEGTGDLLLSIVDNANNTVNYTWGGTGDDFVTGIIEDVENGKLVLSGYAKGELAPKGDQWVHGWGRNLHQSNDSADMEFYDLAKTDSNHFWVVGDDKINGRPIISKFSKDYANVENWYGSIGAESTQINSIDFLRSGDAILTGWTKNFTTKRSGFVSRVNLETQTVAWTKHLYQSVNNHKFTDHTIVEKSGTEYIVGFLENNPNLAGDSDNLVHGLIFLMDENGNVTTSKTTEALPGLTSTDIHIKRLKPGYPGTGDFLFAGSDTTGNDYRTPMWGYGNVLTNDLINFVASHASATTTVADQEGKQREEAAFNDISMISYDSTSNVYEIVAVGKGEDISLAAGDSNGKGGFSFAIAEKNTFTSITSGTAHNITTNWSKRYNSTYGHAEELVSCLVEESDMRDWWHFEDDFFHNGQHKIIVAGTGIDLDSDAVHPDYTSDILMRKDTFFLRLNDSDGSIEWANSLGHMGHDEINKSLVWDGHNRNFVTVGSSTSHSIGEDGVLFRLWKDGFGTGVYHTDASTSNAYYYDSATFTSQDFTTYTDNRDSSTFPDLSFSAITAGTATLGLVDNSSNIVHTEYNGSYGANGLFNAFMAIVDQGDLQAFKNTDQYIRESQSGKIIHRAENLFEIHQVSTVGDATADDGNVFAYDVIKSRDQEYYYLGGQVSGNIARTNDGLSGVYDYTLFQWDIASKQFRFWQNGTAQDEEIYAITELTGTALLVTDPEAVGQGRSTGTVEWTPTTAGTYYYQCGLHAAMGGQLVVTDTQAGTNTYTIGVTNNGSLAYRFTGSDRNGAINAGQNNPTITIDTGDTVRFELNASGHPFYIQTAPGTGGSKNGHIAFCGRTTGQLGDNTDTPLFGGYDLFLGIFDPVGWVAEYYNMGSGFNDKAMNVHDLHPKLPNTLGLVYTSFGSVNGSTTFGSEDIGVITFNYDTDSWSVGFQTGSETSEEIDQNGKPSTKLPDGRVAIVCNTAGAFADDAVTFGLKDMGLAIFDFDSDGGGNYKGFKKYQVGSGSTDFSYSVDNNGSNFLITGYSEATWDREVHGVFVEFDPEKNLLGKSS